MTQIPTWSSGNTAPTSGRAAPGTLIGGRYTLRAAVGHGGMGTVWRAADTLLRRDVAIKEVILPPGLAPSDRDAMYERTMREARAAAALQHPAVVQVYDVVHENGRPWIVMELLDARSLADMVIEDGPVAPRVVAKIGIALLGALEVAHAHGVLHRDVKPANVLICSDGRCVLTDFGVARMPTDVQLTTPGMVLGSPHFISPERAMGSDFGPPSDLFSLGVTLYTAVEGRPPFDKGDPIETMHAVVEDPPTPTVRAGSLDTVLMGLLEKDPAQRFDVQTARTMLRQQLAGPLASKAPPHMMTDPYSVVPAQRPPAAETQPIPPPQPPKPTGQIGGRAMLAPGESLTDHLARLDEGRGGHRRASEQPDPMTEAVPGQPGGADPTSVMPDLRRAAATPPRWCRRARRGTAPGRPETRCPARSCTARPPSARAVVGNTVHAVKQGTGAGGDHGAGLVAQQTAGRRRRRAGRGRCCWSWCSRWPAATTRHRPRRRTPPAGGTQQSSLETQEYKDRGITVKVPKGWKRTAAGELGRLRRPGGQQAQGPHPGGEVGRHRRRASWASPRTRLQNRSTNCPKPYAQVGLTPSQDRGQDGAVLEYTCGTGPSARHGLWGAVVTGGKAYSFYLTTKESQFAESKPIFDEMIGTYALEVS